MGDGAADSRGAGPQPDSQPLSIRTVAVIGAGRVGRSFVLACAAAGFDVVLEDVMPANLRRAQEEYADLSSPNVDSRSTARGPRSADATRPPGTLSVALTVEDAVRAADLAIDFVPDELESKLEIFCLVDRMAPPKTILLTPSDALSITDLASCTYRPDRCFAVRGWIPGATGAGAMRLLHPAGAAEQALTAVQGFLIALGNVVRIEADPDAPMLVKNLR
jgi:3-hydroxybutyryl-CoA dehydrogenase